MHGVVVHSLELHRRPAARVLAAVGCTLGIGLHMLAAVLGLSAVVQVGPTALEVVR